MFSCITTSSAASNGSLQGKRGRSWGELAPSGLTTTGQSVGLAPPSDCRLRVEDEQEQQNVSPGAPPVALLHDDDDDSGAAASLRMMRNNNDQGHQHHQQQAHRHRAARNHHHYHHCNAADPRAPATVRDEFRSLALQASQLPSGCGGGVVDNSCSSSFTSRFDAIPLSDIKRLAVVLGWPSAPSTVSAANSSSSSASLGNEEEDDTNSMDEAGEQQWHDDPQGVCRPRRADSRSEPAGPSASPHRFFVLLFLASGGRLQCLFDAGTLALAPYETAMRQWGAQTLSEAVERVMRAVVRCYRAQCAAAHNLNDDEEEHRFGNAPIVSAHPPHCPPTVVGRGAIRNRTTPQSPVRGASPLPMYAEEALVGGDGTPAPPCSAGTCLSHETRLLPLSQRFHSFCFDVVGAMERDFNQLMMPPSQQQSSLMFAPPPPRFIEGSGYSMGYRGISSVLGIRALQVTLGGASPMVAPLITFLTTTATTKRPVAEGIASPLLPHPREGVRALPSRSCSSSSGADGTAPLPPPPRIAQFSRDLWSMMYVFCRTVRFPSMSGHRNTDCWPSVLDDFVAWWVDTAYDRGGVGAIPGGGDAPSSIEDATSRTAVLQPCAGVVRGGAFVMTSMW